MSEITSIIRSIDNSRYLELFCYDCGKELNELSDFELFALICDNISKTYGSNLKREFLKAISPYCYSLEQMQDRDIQKALWRILNGDISVNIDFAKNSIYRCEPLCFYKSLEDKAVFLGDVLTHKCIMPDTLDVFIQNLCESSANIGINMSKLEYFRPDKYHAEQTYCRLINGEECEISEISALIIWISCRVFMIKNAKLYIIPDKDILHTQRLLELLKERKLTPDVVVVVQTPEDAKKAVRICHEATQKNISSEIVLSEEMSVDSLIDIIKLLVYHLPVTRVRISNRTKCGSNSILERAIDIIQAEGEI